MAGQGYVPKYDAGTNTETYAGGRAEGRGDNAANPPQARRNPHQRGHGHGHLPLPTRRPTRTNPKPAAVEGGLYDDSHIPGFGTWNVGGDQNYTGIFQAASKAKKGQVGGPALEPSVAAAPTGGSGGDLYKPVHTKKRSSSWCCFGA